VTSPLPLPRFLRAFALLVLWVFVAPATALGGDFVLVPQRVAPDVYAFIGAQGEIAPENRGNVINSGFIVGAEG